VNLEAGKWAFAYEKKNFNQADNVYNTMVQACRRLGLRVGEPQWMEVNSLAKPDEVNELIDAKIKSKAKPDIVLFVLPRETYYSALKNACYKRGIVSQCLTFRLANRFNLAIASNVLRQMSMKLGGDSFFLRFEQVLEGTMLVGIDVSHAGHDSSIVGFCATYNRSLSHYYSEVIKQKRKQEIVDK